jgi:diguanylate cyclase (GGDEF)-like protein
MLVNKKNDFNLAFYSVVLTALFAGDGLYALHVPGALLGTHGVFVACACLLYAFLMMGGALLKLAIERKKLIFAERRTVIMQKRKVAHLKKILEVQQAVVGNSSDMHRSVQAIAKESRKALGAEGCVVEMLDGEDIVYYAGSGSGMPFIGSRMKKDGSLSGLSIQESKVLRCDDSETDDRVNRLACRKLRLRSMIVVPLAHNNKNIGVVSVMSSKVSAFDDDDVVTLELMAGLLSAALSDAIAADNLRLNNLELEKLATTDCLTNLQNRRTFQQFLSREYDLAIRHKRQLSLIIMDVDHFKKFNDSFGHPAGDVVLQKVGALLRQLGRKTDCIARFGGEEFVLLMPETAPEQALVLAQRIQETIAGEKWEHRQVTVSVGVCSLDSHISSAADLLEAADKALYAAKDGGRNRVVKAA